MTESADWNRPLIRCQILVQVHVFVFADHGESVPFIVRDEVVHAVKAEHATSHEPLRLSHDVYGMVYEDITETFGRRFRAGQLPEKERLGDAGGRVNVALPEQVAA